MRLDYSQERGALVMLGDPENYYSHKPRSALSVESAPQRQLALEMKQPTVARHQNDKVNVSPNLISKSGKMKRGPDQPAVS